MNKQKMLMLIINILGGTAVIGSYVLGLATHPGQTEALWGGVPGSIRPFYTGNMLLAALGYLALLYFLLFRVDAASAQVGKFGFWVFNLIYPAILIPSALWMSLTFAATEQVSPARWIAVVVVLALTGLSSLGMLAAILKLKPRRPAGPYWLAVAGSIFLVLQTAVLDAILWTVYYLK